MYLHPFAQKPYKDYAYNKQGYPINLIIYETDLLKKSVEEAFPHSSATLSISHSHHSLCCNTMSHACSTSRSSTLSISSITSRLTLALTIPASNDKSLVSLNTKDLIMTVELQSKMYDETKGRKKNETHQLHSH